MRDRMKRERAESVTEVGDDEINRVADDDCVCVGAREAKRRRYERRLPSAEDEVVELD